MNKQQLNAKSVEETGFTVEENEENQKSAWEDFVATCDKITEWSRDEKTGIITVNCEFYENPRYFANFNSAATWAWEEFDGRGSVEGYWHIEDGVERIVESFELTEERVLELLNVDLPDGAFGVPEEIVNAINAAKAWIEAHPAD